MTTQPKSGRWSGLLVGMFFILLGAGCSSVDSASRRPPLAPKGATLARTPVDTAVPVTAESLAALLPEDMSAIDKANRAEAHARYIAGVIGDLNQDPASAFENYRRSALADPSKDLILLEVVRRALQRKEPEKALELLEQLGGERNASKFIPAWKGLVYQQMGRTNEAILANQQAIKVIPKALSGYGNLFQIYLGQKDLPAARAVLQEAFQVRGTDAVFLLELAELYLAYGRAAEAEAPMTKAQALKLVKRAEEQKPEPAPIRLRLAELYQALGEPASAETVYRSVLAIAPGYPTVREKLAFLYWTGNQPEKALEQLEALLHDNPGNPQLHHQLGTLFSEQRKWSEAADAFRRTLVLRPNFEQAYYDHAVALVNLGEAQEAMRVLEASQSRFGINFFGTYLKALAQNRLKNYPRAMQLFAEAEIIAKAGDGKELSHLFYFEAGATAERASGLEQSESYFKKCLELKPDFAEALNYLGYMWAERGMKLAEARQLIEKAVAIEPKNAAFLDSMGWVLFKQGESEAALKYLQESLALSEEPDPTVLDHLGDVYQALHRSAQAQDAWEKSIALEPNDLVKAKLRKIEATPPSQ